MIPSSHTALDKHSLEAEASGLLDRMLGVLQDSSRYVVWSTPPFLPGVSINTSYSEVLIVDATLNLLSVLIRARPASSNRILNAIFSFNPLKLASAPLTPKTKVIVRSMEKTTRMLLGHLARRYVVVAGNPNSYVQRTDDDSDPRNPHTPRIQQYLERLMASKAEVLDGGSRKRAHADVASGLEVKRQRTGPAQPTFQISPLGAGPHSLADVFALTQNAGLRAFDASQVPAALAAKISVNTIARIDNSILDRAIEVSQAPFPSYASAFADSQEFRGYEGGLQSFMKRRNKRPAPKPRRLTSRMMMITSHTNRPTVRPRMTSRS